MLATGVLQGISETTIWLPVWVGSALSLHPAVLAGLYAAIRASSAFSWAFASVVNVLTPKLAEALARRDLERVRRLLVRSAGLGVLTTGPLAIVGVVAASALLGLVQPGYSAYAGVLIALVIARFVDAGTGAVAEALILGDRAGIELLNQLFAVVVIGLVAIVLHPALGVLALGIACAVASCAVNGLRVTEVSLLLEGRWRGWARPKHPVPFQQTGRRSIQLALVRPAAVKLTGPALLTLGLLTLLWLLGVGVTESSGPILLFIWTAVVAAITAAALVESIHRLIAQGTGAGPGAPPRRMAGLAARLTIAVADLGQSAAAKILGGVRNGVGTFRSDWRRTDRAALYAVLALCAGGAWLLAVDPGVLPPNLSFSLGIAIVVTAVTITTVQARRRFPLAKRQLIVSPLTIAAVIWGITFVVRPLQLFASPSSSTYSLWQLGFDTADVARTLGIAGIGCATWCAGYLLGLGRAPAGGKTARRTDPSHWPLSTSTACGLLAVGTILWGVLFLRQGGVGELLSSPASIRKGQQSSGYGFVGIWLVQAVALYAWAAYLNGGGRRVARILLAAALLSLAGALCLQLRQLTVMTILGAALIYLRYRRPTRRAVATAIALAVLGIPVLAFASTFRNYTQFVPLGRSLSLTLRTPPTSFDSADLGTFDNMEVIAKLVPRSVGWLGGSTLRAIPEALVPRSVWPGKPQPIDQQVTDLLLPGQVGGTPIMAQGELYWNLGLPAVALGLGVLGFLMGLATQLGLAVRTNRGILLYAVIVPSTLTLLTRALATMTGNLVLALLATTVAVSVLQAPPDALARFGWLGRKPRRAVSSSAQRA